MSVAAPPLPRVVPTFADLYAKLGRVPMERIWMEPPPGTATLADAEAANDRCELVHGTLLEKPMGVFESYLAVRLAGRLEVFLDTHNVGFLMGADGKSKLSPKLAYSPDVAFVSWAKAPGGVPRTAFLEVVPDLVLEVLSPSNTAEEMERKVRDYLAAGVQVVWLIEPELQTVEAHTPSGVTRTLRDGTLTAEPLLPGFSLPLAVLFTPRLPPKP